MYIHYPAVFKRHELVHGPLLEPTNEAQQTTYEAALKQQEFASNFKSHFIPSYFAAYVRHNLNCAGLNYLPVSLIGSPADLVEPYSKWRGFEYLICSGSADYHLLPAHSSADYAETHYMDALQRLRRLRLDASDPSDILVLDDAEKVCINQITKMRKRQRKRLETV